MQVDDPAPYCQVKMFKNDYYGGCYCSIGMHPGKTYAESRKFKGDAGDKFSSFTLSYGLDEAPNIHDEKECNQCNYDKPGCVDECTCSSSKWCTCS